MSEHQSEAASIAAIVAKYNIPTVLEIGTVEGKPIEVLVLPGNSGMRVEPIKPLLDPYRTEPERRKGTARFTDLVSFIEHVKRFADADSVIFADENKSAPKLVAVLDYHRQGAEGAPRMGGHRAEYAFPLAEEWGAWNSKNEDSFAQGAFAAWVEDRIADVLDPAQAGDGAKEFARQVGVSELASPSRLLELSRGLSIKEDCRVTNTVNLQSGETQLNFEAKHTDESGGAVRVPGAFLLGIPVFEKGALYQIPARLRYRKNGPSILWSFALYRTEKIFDHAIREACAKAQQDTGLPLYFGSPEA